MNIRTAVERFTVDTVTDPYGVEGSIKGRVSVFDDEKSSGDSTRRRILETLPTYAMFSSSCILHSSIVYLVGKPSYDYHRGSAVRVKYPIIPCDHTYKVASILQILTATLPTSNTYAFLSPSRNAVADSETSYATSLLTAYFQGLESVSKGQILITGTQYYRVKSDAVIDGAGFKVAEVIMLNNPLQTMTFTVKTGYDPITDTIVNGTVYSNTKVFVEDAYYAYDRTTERYMSLKPGDKNITIKPSVTPKAGDDIGGYKILTVDTLSDSSFSCHCRR